MNMRIPALLVVLATIGSGVGSIAHAQDPLPPSIVELVQLNDDVICEGCPPGPQTWELRIIYSISETCTEIHTYQGACVGGCPFTFVGSTSSGNCGAPAAPVAEVEVTFEGDDNTIEWTGQPVKTVRQYDYGIGCSRYVVTTCVCDPACGCVQSGTWWTDDICRDLFETQSAERSREDLNAGGPAAMAFQVSSRNPSTGPVVFRLGVPEASRGAREELVMFDAFGRRVHTLVSGAAEPGWRNRTWDLRTSAGSRTRPGVYYARYHLGNETRKQTVVIVN